MAVYFIADMHFGDENILRYENRPFATTAEMDSAILSNWNRTVAPDDIVYVLGDIGNENLLCQLNGVKYLVKGNHDTADNAHYREIGFAEVYDLPVIYDDFWILSHEPLYVNRNMPYANLFGHIHNHPAYHTTSSHGFCVSVERINYTPISMADIKAAVIAAQTREDGEPNSESLVR